MTTLVVGIGEFSVSATKGDVLKTFALGSCVGVTIIDPHTGVTGLLHLVLPEAKTNLERARTKPGYFADSGLTAMIQEMERHGIKKTRRWIVKLAGGAKVINTFTSEALEIGKRNILATKKNLWKLGLGAVAEDIGKHHSRTVIVTVGSSEVLITNAVKGELRI